MGKNWVKIGTVRIRNIPEYILNSTVERSDASKHVDVESDSDDFWYERGQSTLKTFTGSKAETYFNTLNLPKFEYTNVSLLSIMEEHPWHTDKNRCCAINIAIKNGNTCRVEFDDGPGFIMEDGDIYCIDVTKEHRVVPITELEAPRMVLSITLQNPIEHPLTQKTINKIRAVLRLVGRG